jgi:opacity protein-like surface antigen
MRQYFLLLFSLLTVSSEVFSFGAATNDLLPASTDSIWKDPDQGGFNKGTKDAGLSFGEAFGMRILGSSHKHYFALGIAQFGWVLTDPVGTDHWYRGNWELKFDIFGGAQYYPDDRYVVGGGPILRYDFATSRFCVPFIEAGLGLAGTSIRDGDLSTSFEFNLQCGVGAHLFVTENVALTLEYRFLHISNAGIDSPNQGVNESTGLVGVTFFFQ